MKRWVLDGVGAGLVERLAAGDVGRDLFLTVGAHADGGGDVVDETQSPEMALSLVDHVTTAVRMRPYSDDEIAAYIARGEPFDKAGAYAIQDQAFRPVASYDACYCNVVGLPLRAVIRLLQQGGVDITNGHLAGLPAECERCRLEV